MSPGQVLGLAAGLLGALLFGVGAVVQAHAVRRLGVADERLPGFVRRGIHDPLTLAVVAAYLAGFALHAVAIWLLPLYLAQAVVALSLPVTAFVSRRLEEHLTTPHLLGVLAVTLGLILLSLGAGGAGSVITTGAFAAMMWAGVALLLLASLASGRLGGALLGGLAGLGYAGSAIAVRGVGTPVDAVVLVAALSLPAYGLVAFWLYSLGLERARVSSATASMIVGQTFVPAVVGVGLLGDGVRAGWWSAVVLGLLLSVAGAVALSGEASEVAPLR